MKELEIFRKFLNEDRETFDYDKLTRKQIEKLEDLKAKKEKKSKFKKAGEKAGFDMRGLKENLETLVAQGEKMAAFADKQSGYEGGIDSPVRNVLTAMKVAGGPGFDGDDEMIDYYTRKLSKAIENQKGKKYMQGLEEYGGAEFDEETAKRNMFAAKYNKPGDTERFRSYMIFLSDLRDSGKTNMFGAAPYLQQTFDLDKKEAREILAYWMKGWRNMDEGKQLKEFVGKELEDRNEPLYSELVPGAGKADTVQGEMLRAINRIVYRYYNDGDEYMRGYGTETAGPAHSFLVNANHPLKSLVSTLFSKGTDYEQTIKDVLDAILDHVESRQGKYTPNNVGNMFDYEPEFEDEESYEDDWDDDDYYDEDDY